MLKATNTLLVKTVCRQTNVIESSLLLKTSLAVFYGIFLGYLLVMWIF